MITLDLYRHNENVFNDFAVEVLLAALNSTLDRNWPTGGPQLETDLDDYIVGGIPIGQRAAVYI